MQHWWIQVRFRVCEILSGYHIRRTGWYVERMNRLNDKLDEYLEELNDD